MYLIVLLVYKCILMFVSIILQRNHWNSDLHTLNVNTLTTLPKCEVAGHTWLVFRASTALLLLDTSGTLVSTDNSFPIIRFQEKWKQVCFYNLHASNKNKWKNLLHWALDCALNQKIVMLISTPPLYLSELSWCNHTNRIAKLSQFAL